MSIRAWSIDPVHVALRPLSPAVFWGLGAGLALIFAAYCQLHGVIGAARVPATISLSWGLALALPWWSAWEGCKRLGGRSGARLGAGLTTLLMAALLANVSLHYGIGAVAHPDGHAGWVELLYGRFPLALGMALGALLLRPWNSAPSPREVAQPVRSEIDSIAERATPARSAPSAAGDSAPPVAAILRVPTRSGCVELSARDLDYVKSAGNYVELTAAGRSWLLRATLHEIEAMLTPIGFVRIHRSLLVNPARVARLQRDARKLPALRLSCGATLPVGRRYIAAVERLSPRRD